MADSEGLVVFRLLTLKIYFSIESRQHWDMLGLEISNLTQWLNKPVNPINFEPESPGPSVCRVVSQNKGTTPIKTPKYYSPYYGYPQSGTPNFGKPLYEPQPSKTTLALPGRTKLLKSSEPLLRGGGRTRSPTTAVERLRFDCPGM